MRKGPLGLRGGCSRVQASPRNWQPHAPTLTPASPQRLKVQRCAAAPAFPHTSSPLWRPCRVQRCSVACTAPRATSALDPLHMMVTPCSSGLAAAVPCSLMGALKPTASSVKPCSTALRLMRSRGLLDLRSGGGPGWITAGMLCSCAVAC